MKEYPYSEEISTEVFRGKEAWYLQLNSQVAQNIYLHTHTCTHTPQGHHKENRATCKILVNPGKEDKGVLCTPLAASI